MGPLLKLLVVALLTLPASAFVVGRLSVEPVGTVPQRGPVVLEDPLPAEPAQTITGRPAPVEQPGRSGGPGPVEVIGPGPTELDDERDEDGQDVGEKRDDAHDGGAGDDDGAADDADVRDPAEREDDEETEAEEPDGDDPEDDDRDETDDEERDGERDEEDDEVDDD